MTNEAAFVFFEENFYPISFFLLKGFLSHPTSSFFSLRHLQESPKRFHEEDTRICQILIPNYKHNANATAYPIPKPSSYLRK